MEGYIVDGVDCIVDTVAFEGVLFLLLGVGGGGGGYTNVSEVFNGHSTFDGSNGYSGGGGGEEFDAACLVFEGGVSLEEEGGEWC